MDLSDFSFDVVERDNRAAFDSVLTICRQVIEPSEQKTDVEMRAMFNSADYVFLAARRGSEIVAFSSLFMPSEDDFWLLEYLAVSAAAQGQGLGAQLFAASAAHAGTERIGLIEVDALPAENDVGTIADDKRGKAHRRLAFYGRMGCFMLTGLDYLLPLEAYGTPPPMVLLVHGTSPRTLTRSQITRWLRVIYVSAYGQSADDARIDAMMTHVPEPPSLTACAPRDR